MSKTLINLEMTVDLNMEILFQSQLLPKYSRMRNDRNQWSHRRPTLGNRSHGIFMSAQAGFTKTSIT
jgi:hypothetical protein